MNPYFSLTNIIVRQMGFLAMGSTFSHTLTDNFLCHYEELWLHDYLNLYFQSANHTIKHHKI